LEDPTFVFLFVIVVIVVKTNGTRRHEGGTTQERRNLIGFVDVGGGEEGHGSRLQAPDFRPEA